MNTVKSLILIVTVYDDRNIHFICTLCNCNDVDAVFAESFKQLG